MKLTNQHIQELYTFTRQHYVEYYDIQTELVDHLSSDIETIWSKEPKFSFAQARDKSFKKFGICGFMDIVDKRTQSLEKKYWKLVWQVFVQFFKIPQITLTILLFFGIYQLFFAFPQTYIIPSFSIVLFTVLIVRLITLQAKKKKQFAKNGRKWLLEDSIYRLGNIMLFGNVFLQLGVQIKTIRSFEITLLLAFLFTIFTLLIYITAFVLPSEIEIILEKQYPEYKRVTNL